MLSASGEHLRFLQCLVVSSDAERNSSLRIVSTYNLLEYKVSYS